MVPSRTALYNAHQAAGAKLVPFAGWDMPLQYTSMLAEAKATRASCGLFDVSHMGKAFLTGPQALNALLKLCTNDAARLAAGQAQYTLLCNEAGGALDDLIIYHIGEEAYLLVINASNTETDLAWMRRHLPEGANLRDDTEGLSLVAVQGPRSVEALRRVLPTPVADLPSFGVLGCEVAGAQGWIARTGYTGEDGFEVFCRSDRAPELWDQLAGQPEVTLCGLGARDILRTEAGYPLYGHELSADACPLEAGLGWVIRKGGGYIGDGPIEKVRAEGAMRRLRGLMLQDRGIARPGFRVLSGDEEVGVVTSGTFSPNLQASIAMASLKVGAAKPGTSLTVEGDRRPLQATVVALPFHRFPKFGPA
jgi:aminomethyltransferase